ncbi:helix-turn-helix domain-containing protein [Sporomusa aerivorans]|uniref:helix-turn-helix domain-containing protein n=1 Tax=Sporomusa aerivorans TaxID=204936 RepID=UPI003529ED06
MSIIRVEKQHKYTCVSNVPLQDARLSLKARGLITYCLSLPDNWTYSVSGLVKVIGAEGKSSIQSALHELETCGYLIRRRLHDNSGKFTGTEYVLYEEPQIQAEQPFTENRPMTVAEEKEPFTDFPSTEKPPTAKPSTENQPLQNTYSIKQEKEKIHTQQSDAGVFSGEENKGQGEKDASAAVPLEQLVEIAIRCRIPGESIEKLLKRYPEDKIHIQLLYLESQKSKVRDPVAWLFQALKQEYDAPLPKPKPTIIQPPPLPPLPEVRGEPLSPEFQALLDRIHKRMADKGKKGEDG